MHYLQNNCIINWLFYPFSMMYRGITDLRNWLFDSGIFKQTKLSAAVISVGNITAGGSGKTPFIMLLINLLSPSFSNIVVVSRGYGRRSKGLKIVSDGNKVLMGVVESGDEPFMIAKRFPTIPVIVSENRVLGIKKAQEKFKTSLVLLDDAFQHRWVARDCDIVLINKNIDLRKERTLPLGNLREHPNHLRRANILVRTGAEENDHEKHKQDEIAEVAPENIFNCEFQIGGVVDSDLKSIGSEDLLAGKSCVAFAAIANPGQFVETLKQAKIHIDEFVSFPDHHFYSESDQTRLREKVKLHNSDFLITTEKDIVKIDPVLLNDIRIVALRRDGFLEEAELFMNKLATFIDFKK
jgi:tetraacyldisaccharide 4'-kinase